MNTLWEGSARREDPEFYSYGSDLWSDPTLSVDFQKNDIRSILVEGCDSLPRLHDVMTLRAPTAVSIAGAIDTRAIHALGLSGPD